MSPQAVIITGEGTWRDAQEMLDRFGIKVVVINSYYTDQFADTKYLCFIKSVFEARLIFKNIIINADDFIYGTNSNNASAVFWNDAVWLC